MNRLILMVEDEALVAMCLQDTLERAGYAVHHAFRADEALQLLESKGSALGALITDIRFGTMISGWVLARRAREIVPALPVIYISGDSAHEHARLGVERSTMLSKPFAPEKLLNALQEALTRSSSGS